MSVGLLALTGYAAWYGMYDFAAGTPAATVGRDFLSALAAIHDSVFAVTAALLSTALLISLRELTGAGGSLNRRLLALPIYVALTLWSVSFGYGYWWSLLARQDNSSSGIAALQLDARDAASVVAVRIEAIKAQVELAVSWSENQLTREERSGGGICGVNGSSGRVGLFMSRRNVRDTVTQLTDKITKSWFTPVQFEIEMLRQAASALDTVLDKTGETGALMPMEKLSAQVRGGARSIAHRHNELGRVSAAELRNLAYTVSVSPGQAGFVCHDPALSARLLQAADQADDPVRLQLREAVFSAGPAGVANAVYNLWNNFGIYANGLATVASSGSALASAAKAIDHTSGGDPVKSRDMLALIAALASNLGLFVLALNNPVPIGVRRRQPVAPVRPAGVLSQPAILRHIGSAFRTALERAPAADLEWLRQHFVHHAGTTYFVIPNLSGVHGPSEDRQVLALRAMALNQLAGVLEDVRLIRSINPPIAPIGGWFPKSKPQKTTARHVPLLLQELLAKADRALAIAGWSADSKREIEAFEVVHVDGSPPLLCLINQTTLSLGISAAEDAIRWPVGHPRHRPLRLEFQRSG